MNQLHFRINTLLKLFQRTARQTPELHFNSTAQWLEYMDAHQEEAQMYLEDAESDKKILVSIKVVDQ